MNRIRVAAVGITLAWVGYVVLFPNWQEAAEREKDYRKDLGVHFVLNPPAPVSVPCYFVGCITAPSSYFHVVIDRRGFYPTLACMTAWLMVALAVFRTEKNGSAHSLATPRMRLLAVSLIALVLPVSGTPYFPLGNMVPYLPTAVLHPNHDHISVLIGFPFFFAVYFGAVYLVLRAAIWANALLRPGH